MHQSTKPCATCKERPRMSPAKPGGSASSYCRECWNARMRDYRRVHGSPKKTPQATCSRCGNERDGRHPGYCRACWLGPIREEKLAGPCGRCGKQRAGGDRTNSVYCYDCWRNWWLLRKYGVSGEQYEQMLAAQDQRCAICRSEANGRTWHVDHCHDTGRVRGILCDLCNRGLGHFQEDPARLRLAAEYLEANASA